MMKRVKGIRLAPKQEWPLIASERSRERSNGGSGLMLIFVENETKGLKAIV